MGKQPIVYKCSMCGEVRSRDQLVAKRVQYKEMGMEGKVLTTRVVAWLCTVLHSGGAPCLELDEHFNIPAYTSAPGTAAKTLPEDERASEA